LLPPSTSPETRASSFANSSPQALYEVHPRTSPCGSTAQAPLQTRSCSNAVRPNSCTLAILWTNGRGA